MVANLERQSRRFMMLPMVFRSIYWEIPVLHKLAAEAGLHRIFSTLSDSRIQILRR
jgi:hypothetical protein